MNAYASFNCNSQKLETIQILSMGKWINKSFYIHGGMEILNNKKEWTVDIYNNIDESQNNDVTWKKTNPTKNVYTT